jgi:mannitol-1-phosphate/altronate dehydrogenase
VAKAALKEECGAALVKKFNGLDPLFSEEGYATYADALVTRMVSPLLDDSVERVMLDMARKLSWDDRLIGAMRLCLSQGVKPARLALGVVSQREIQVDKLPALWRSGDSPCKLQEMAMVMIELYGVIASRSGESKAESTELASS